MWLEAAELRHRVTLVTAAWLVLIGLGAVWVVAMGDAHGSALLRQWSWGAAHHALVAAVSDWGLYPFYGLFGTILWWGWRSSDPFLRLSATAYILAQLLGSVLVVRAMKMIFGRPRPDAASLLEQGGHWVGPTWQAAFHSFPSGHAADIFTSAIFCAVLFRRRALGAVALVFAVAIALTRVVLAKHYPSDVLAGAAIAGITSLLLLWLWLPGRLGDTVDRSCDQPSSASGL
jgi:membrane-associated phospholipid phosphatase